MTAITPSNSEQSPNVQLSNGELVSMQAVQAMYAELTGREESLSTEYKINHEVRYEDLYQLNAKIFQITEQYNIVGKNCSITIYHQNNTRQVFSNFQNFQIYDRTINSPTERVTLEYDFLVILPNVKKPQSYNVNITIISRAAAIKALKSESKFKSQIFLEMLSETTGGSEIKYIDYSVARSFQSAIKEWFEGLPNNPEKPTIAAIKRRKHIIPSTVSCLAAIIFSSIFVYFTYGNVQELKDAFLAIVMTVVGAFVIGRIFTDIGNSMQHAVSRICPLSLINLTRGDEILKSEFEKSNKSDLNKFITTPIISIAINLLSSWIFAKIYSQF